MTGVIARYISHMKYRRNKLMGKLAHGLVRIAKRIMPDGHCKGVFRSPSNDMKNDLARYGRALSRADSENSLLRAQMALFLEMSEKAKDEKRYEVSDQIRKIMSTGPGPNIPALKAKYAEFEKTINYRKPS